MVVDADLDLMAKAKMIAANAKKLKEIKGVIADMIKQAKAIGEEIKIFKDAMM